LNVFNVAFGIAVDVALTPRGKVCRECEPLTDKNFVRLFPGDTFARVAEEDLRPLHLTVWGCEIQLADSANTHAHLLTSFLRATNGWTRAAWPLPLPYEQNQVLWLSYQGALNLSMTIKISKISSKKDDDFFIHGFFLLLVVAYKSIHI
jgi:hypothetical protein